MRAIAIRVLVGLGLVCSAPPARALESAGAAVGAQPGFYRVGLPEHAPPTLAGTLGYGFTEAQDDAPGGHHRLSFRVAGAAAPIEWLNIAPELGGRYDFNPNDTDSVIDMSLAARAFVPWRMLRLGAELELWTPGAESASSFPDTLSLDSRALVAIAFEHARIGLSLGYRLDRSANAAANAAKLGPEDRLALGLSSFDAVLIGIGGEVELGRSQIFAEISGDILFGRGAPSFVESPLRATAGVRHALSRPFTVELLTDISLSGRPDFDPEALVPIEPRISLLAGVRYRFLPSEAAKAPPRTPPARRGAPEPIARPPETTFELSVVDDEGAAVPDAKVVMTIGGARREFAVDATGRYRDEHAPAGAAELRLEARGFEPEERSLVFEAGKPQNLDVALKALPPPSQVRGSVRSFGGAPLVAHVRVEPIGFETTTDASGQFELDVPPGSYDVAIEADGYASQRRKITVEPKGVVILNADLPKKR